MGKYEHKWRELTHGEKAKYAMAMRRLNLGFWGYPVSTLWAVHLTTREGNDNSTEVFAKDLRKLVGIVRGKGYDVQYDGALEYTPGKRLLHWHGIWRVKGGFLKLYDGDVKSMVVSFIDDKGHPHSKHINANRSVLGTMWNEIHGAFRVEIDGVESREDLEKYITKHILKEYLGEDDLIRNKSLFSKGWMREGWKEVESLAKTWVLGGLDMSWMNSERWKKVNEIMKAWAEKRKAIFLGKMIDGKRTGYLYMELGRIREVVGGAFEPCGYEYYDY
jgi:hypothetical protein